MQLARTNTQRFALSLMDKEDQIPLWVQAYALGTLGLVLVVLGVFIAI